ncbi:hypothetical protein [Thermophilibacter sp.]
MAMTHDYLDHLNETIGISPANSQEELQAAQVVAELMSRHDVEPRVEDFEAPLLSGLTGAILSVAMFLGVLVSGFGALPLTLVGLVLAAIPAVRSVMRLFGRELPLSFGPRAQSQNVVAVHRATGPLVTKGSRTIVVAAHYDTPRENLLVTSPLAPYLTLIHKVQVPCSFAVLLCAFVQLLGFLPSPVRIILWIAGILAAVPALVVAVGSIAERTAACTLGANDNKAAVAAMLGVLENVRPSGEKPRERPVAPVVEEPTAETVPDEGEAPGEGELAAEAEPATAAAPYEDAAPAEPEPEGVPGVRHGAEVLRALGILPESCEIVYEAVGRPAGSTTEIPVARPAAPVSEPEPAPADETASVAVPEPPDEVAAEAADETAQTTRADLLASGRFDEGVEEGYGVGPKDTTGVLTLADDATADELEATAPATPVQRPEAPSDPEWGKTSYRPQLSSVARRASLYDLPDPSGEEVDPFDATDPGATRVQAPQEVGPAPEPLSTIGPEDLDEASRAPRLGGLRGLLSRFGRRRSGGRDAEDDGAGDDGSWRGGAAMRGGLRLVDAEDDPAEDAPTDDELRDAVLKLGDDALIAHDIWFVALGGSALDHAGMRSFLAAHRSEIRGCFVVNLDCVGAGELTVLRNEGLEETRRGDRRITRLLTGAASDLHMELAQAPHDWGDTDATPAMRSSLRSVTVMGLDENGLPALSHTPNDVPDNVSGDQAADVAALVTEMIRRS